MTYEYDVPYVDFITSFGEDDGADTYFDPNFEFEKLSLKQTSSQGRNNNNKNERPILQEIHGNVKNTGSAQGHRIGMQISSPCGSKSLKVQKIICQTDSESVSQDLKSQVELGFTMPVSATKLKKHIQTIEEVNGELCVKNNEVKHTGVAGTIPNQRTRAIVQHSFEERQKLQLIRRGEQIKKVLEEEQRKRQFHANPIPNYLKLKSTSETKSSSSTQNSTTNTFRARPASVVHRKPFSPRKMEHSVVKHTSVLPMHSEQRAKARQEFNDKLRQRCKELEDEVLARKEEELQKEKKEIAALRKKLIHKAQPVPVYKTVHVITNSKCTRSKDQQECL